MSPWLKIGLSGAIAVVVGAIAATLWIGAGVREDTVVPNPYEAGLRLTERQARGARDREPACDLSSRPCTLPLPRSGEVTLDLAPRPLRTMVELRVRAVVREPARGGGGEDVVVAFSMAGMEMGKNEVRLVPAGGARTGTAVLVRCPSGRKDWIAEVRVGEIGGPVRAVRFPFTVEE